MQYKNLPRLYLHDGDFYEDKNIILSDDKTHYLRNVMRLATGDNIRVFNGISGDWIAKIENIDKKKSIISLNKKIFSQKDTPDIWVLASPVKKESFEWMIEKASELGAERFIPVVCDHTVIHRMNTERASLIAVEAAEQCERQTIMKINNLEKLKDVLKDWPASRTLIICLERSSAAPVAEAVKKLGPDASVAVLIGPEGGFSEGEAAFLQAQPFVLPVSLGPRILKAETALCAALACVQAHCGDWLQQ